MRGELRFERFKVLVAGDVMLDQYYFGEVSRISPEAPVPVVQVKRVQETLGGAANVVNNLAHLNLKTALLGVAGQDAARNSLEALLKERNTDFSLFGVASPTITKIRVMGGHQQVVRVDFEQPACFSVETRKIIETQFIQLLTRSDLVILSDYGKGFCDADFCRFAIEQVLRQGKKILVDPKGKNWEKYRGAFVVTPNLKELSEICGMEIENQDEAVAREGEKVRTAFGLNHLLITRSEKGMTLISDASILHFQSHAQEVYDVSGAGDTVVAVLGALLASGVPIQEAVPVANRAAGVVVGKLGTAPITLYELNQELGQSFSGKRVMGAQLEALMTSLKSQGKKIVFTNGCFDILHRGHVAYLKQARALGDILIVGVNSDDSVKKLKGPSRPVNAEFDRMEVLEGLESVSYVVLFEEETPERLIKEIRPDFLVKGGDYRIEEIVGREFAGKTLTIPFVEGYSTTATLKKAKGDVS